MKTKIWFGIIISALFIWLAFRKIDYHQLWLGLTEANYIYVVPAIVITLFQYYLRSVRWGYIIEPVKKVSRSSLLSSIMIGYMANNILPARIGEFVRAYVLGKRENISISSSFATVVIERIIDTFTVFVLMLVVFRFVSFPPERAALEKTLQKGGGIAAIVFLLILIMLFYFKNHKDIFKKLINKVVKPLSQKAAHKLTDFSDSFASGLSVLKRDKHIFMISGYSLVIWIMSAAPIYLILMAFGYVLPLSVSLFILVLLAFAVAIPSAPGFIGTFHYAVAMGLEIFSVPAEEALSVAIILHAINFFPVTMIGLYYLWRGKISLAEAEKLEGST